MKDPALEDYCAAIESFFFQLKGRPGTLSPADFARVKVWFSEGVTLQAALDGIAEAFRSQSGGRNRDAEEVNGLGFCERFIAPRR
jgi:hypothetical protein